MPPTHSDKLTWKMMAAMLLGLVLGLILNLTGNGEWGGYLGPVGDIFIRLLKFIIIPLVFSSLYIAVINLGDVKALGQLGKKTIIYYMTTTALAVLVGIILVNLFEPGVGADIGVGQLPEALGAKLSAQKGLFATILGVLMDAIPKNPFESLAKANILQIIVFALIFGVTALFFPAKTKTLSEVLGGIEKISIEFVNFLMRLAPYGIFALMLSIVSRTGLGALVSLGKYMLVVIIGLLAHGLILVLIGAWRSKKSPLLILRKLSPALLTAFSTSSSAATLPVSMRSVEEGLGVSSKSTKFILPLGATINMDGTALYESIAVIFIAQAYGINLDFSQQIVIFLTASLAAVGAAAIPGAGLVTMSIVLTAVGLPLEGIGLILAVDRILDMCRTMVNVLGDCIGTLVVESFNKSH